MTSLPQVRYTTNENAYISEQSYNAPNPIITTGAQSYGESQYANSYLPTTTYTGAAKDLVYTYANVPGANSSEVRNTTTYNYGTAGAGTTASNVRGTVVNEVYAPPPKITFGHPSGGYAQTSTSYYQPNPINTVNTTTVVTNQIPQPQVQTITSTVVQEPKTNVNSQVVRTNPSTTASTTYTSKNDDFLCSKWCWILTAILGALLLTLALLYGLGVIGGGVSAADNSKVSVNGPNANINGPNANISGPNANINGPSVSGSLPNVNVNGPNANINGPNLSGSLPNVNVNGPKVNGQLPSVNANLPSVNANLPSVNTNLPSVNNNWSGSVPSVNNNWSSNVAPAVSGTTSVSSLPSGGVAPVVVQPTAYTPTVQTRPSTATVTPATIAPASIAPVPVESTTYTGYNTYAAQPAPQVATSFKPTVVQPSSIQPTYTQPNYAYTQPNYAYTQPTYQPTQPTTQPTTYNYGSFVPAVPVE